jgi:hypothetical protein
MVAGDHHRVNIVFARIRRPGEMYRRPTEANESLYGAEINATIRIVQCRAGSGSEAHRHRENSGNAAVVEGVIPSSYTG